MAESFPGVEIEKEIGAFHEEELEPFPRLSLYKYKRDNLMRSKKEKKTTKEEIKLISALPSSIKIRTPILMPTYICYRISLWQWQVYLRTKHITLYLILREIEGES